MTGFNKNFIVKSFIKGLFSCFPLLWMFRIRAVNHKINRFHKRGLRGLLKDETLPFNDVLLKINNTTIHVGNIQKLMIEL